MNLHANRPFGARRSNAERRVVSCHIRRGNA